MSLAGRVTTAIVAATAISIGVAALIVRRILHSYLALFASHFAMMQRTLGWGPDLQTIHALVDRGLLVALLVAILIATSMGAYLGAGVARGVALLREGFDRYARGQLDERIAPSGPVELRSIATSANIMAEQLRHARLAERELVAGIAHDLAHPLTAMRGTVEAGRDGIVDLSDPDVLGRLLSTMTEVDAAIGDLRDVAAAEVGALQLRPRITDVKLLVERIASTYADLARRKGIELQTKATAVTARTDERRLGRILANLLTNALQATPPGESVRIETLSDGSQVVLRVEDTGGPHAAERIRLALDRGIDAGLGLRVVRTVGCALGARISVHQGLQGAIVEVVLHQAREPFSTSSLDLLPKI
jgi:two-component system sensor histidine kinase BaeS